MKFCNLAIKFRECRTSAPLPYPGGRPGHSVRISGQFSLALSIRSDSLKGWSWTWATFPRTGNMLR
jgi:hypothetical protein